MLQIPKELKKTEKPLKDYNLQVQNWSRDSGEEEDEWSVYLPLYAEWCVWNTE